MAVLPRLELRQAVVEEDVEEGEELVVLGSDHGIKLEQRVKVENEG
jgi:hypothetical protein